MPPDTLPSGGNSGGNVAGFNWTCGYCNRPQVGSGGNSQVGTIEFSIGENAFEASVGLRAFAAACLNKDCKRVTLTAGLLHYSRVHGQVTYGNEIQSWPLLPESRAKPQPDSVPSVLRTDYYEACRIIDLSPKASATLARRCLQGMIRDFAGISKSTLDSEIQTLQARLNEGSAPRGVTHESVEAIDHVRKLGNIGAHMEKDVNLIIDIDTGEAAVLLELIEMLFQEWYVAQFEREKRLKTIAAIRAEKDQLRQQEGVVEGTAHSNTITSE